MQSLTFRTINEIKNENAEELIKLRDSGATQEEMISVVTESTGLPKETVEQELAKFDPYNLS